MTIAERLSLYMQLTRLNRPIGILLLLWPTLWGVWIAGDGHPAWHIVLIFTLGTVLMRSAGCAINDYADRHIDLHVERTRQRPITSGRIAPREAVWLAAALALISFLLILPLNNLTRLMSIPAVFLAGSYPFTKRFFVIPQAYLGIAFGFGIPMAFAAHHNFVAPLAWAMVVANVFWAIAYDTEYGMVDRDDDVKLGLKSSAILFGRFDVFGVMVCHTLFLSIMTYIGTWARLGLFYFVGLVIAACLAGYQYLLIHERQRERCFRAFLNNNWLGAAIYAGIVADFLLRIPLFSVTAAVITH